MCDYRSERDRFPKVILHLQRSYKTIQYESISLSYKTVYKYYVSYKIYF